MELVAQCHCNEDGQADDLTEDDVRPLEEKGQFQILTRHVLWRSQAEEGPEEHPRLLPNPVEDEVHPCTDENDGQHTDQRPPR